MPNVGTPASPMRESDPSHSDAIADSPSSGGVRWLAVAGAAAAGLTLVALTARATAHLVTRLPRYLRRPRQAGGLDLEPVSFPSLDGTPLRGWLARAGASEARGVGILCHGYMQDHLDVVPVARFLQRAGYTCLLFDFRAAGQSGGDRCTIGYQEALDVRGALRFLASLPEMEGRPRFGVGRSMGGAALALAAPHAPELAALVLDGVYPDLRQALDSRCRLIWGPLGPLAARAALPVLRRALGVEPAEVSPRAVLQQLEGVPTLLIHADWDIFIPQKVARAMAESTAEPKEFWQVPRATHCWAHVWYAHAYERRVLAFLERSLPHGRNIDLTTAIQPRNIGCGE
ncbi:MAG: alpha/beta hydrolase [Armatimonadetes bacterium]|nr:alpha/beta hydrolase [Armatimonadota bacterium]